MIEIILDATVNEPSIKSSCERKKGEKRWKAHCNGWVKVKLGERIKMMKENAKCRRMPGGRSTTWRASDIKLAFSLLLIPFAKTFACLIARSRSNRSRSTFMQIIGAIMMMLTAKTLSQTMHQSERK